MLSSGSIIMSLMKVSILNKLQVPSTVQIYDITKERKIYLHHALGWGISYILNDIIFPNEKYCHVAK
jgi:hypothetical protein